MNNLHINPQRVTLNMIYSKTMTVAWIRDKETLWLRVATAALRRHAVLDKIRPGSRVGDGFIYLEAESARCILKEIRGSGQSVKEIAPPQRFAKHAMVRTMPQVNQHARFA